jgi:hypothetical protein
MKMITNGHYIGSGRCQNRGKKYVKEVGIKRMFQEDFDREFVELKERLSIIMWLLQESEED